MILTPTRKITVALFVALLNISTSLSVADAMVVHRGSPVKVLAATQPLPARISVKMYQAAQALEVQYDAERDMTARVVISNIIGKVAQTTSIELQTGENQTRIDVANLPQGTYIVQVVGTGWTSEARKFIKANP